MLRTHRDNSLASTEKEDVMNSFAITLCFLMASPAGAATLQTKARIKVPSAVQKTVDEQSKGATVRGLSKEVENGKTQYELELTINGHGRDVIIDPNGSILEVEEEISLDSLPPELRAEIVKSIGNAKLLKLESVTKGGMLTGYEADVSKGGKKSIQLGTDGKFISKEK